ncbi:hypothetical protein EMCRGX_G019399 [Ephydatia muelleri]
MKKHLLEAHNIEEPAKSTSSHMKHPKDAASPATSGQGHGTLTGSGLINKHFMPVMPPFTTEEHKRAYALMVRAHSAAILPPSINDIPGFASTWNNGANFKAAVQQLLDEDVTEENPACACHTFSLVVKNAIDPCKKKVPDHATRAFIQLFRDITNAIRNSSQRLEHLKSLQKEKIDADKNIMEIINEDVQVEPVLFPHSATALTVIKDIVTRWNSTYYIIPVLTEEQWMSANKLCQLLKPLREISAFFEEGPPSSWNLGVREWDELPSEVYECFLSLKTGFKTRFNPSSFLLTDAALVHPGHKSLSWLEPTGREEALQQFKDELLIVAGIEGLPDPSNSPSSLDIQEDAVPNQSALDAFFDFDVSQCNFIL